MRAGRQWRGKAMFLLDETYLPQTGKLHVGGMTVVSPNRFPFHVFDNQMCNSDGAAGNH